MLEAIKERHIDLVLMGWKGSTTTPGRVFSRVVDTMIRQASCEVVLVKLGDFTRFDRWLVPTAGGPNAEAAIRLLPAFVALAEVAQVRLFHVGAVSEPSSLARADSVPNAKVLQSAAEFLTPRMNAPVLLTSVSADSVPATVLNYAKQENSDVILLGASREGLLQQVQSGNIPAMISRQSHCTVILVRGIQT